jgi:mRNA-degrading endonuclease YafQ of YafQ-DinJ toxin-antitoxin module
MAPWATPWKVQLDPVAEKELKQSLKDKRISPDDLAVIKAWVTTVEENGPEFISTRAAAHWNDHPLFGNRSGQRSSSFSDAGRIIYRVNERENIIGVLRVTEDHDYTMSKGGKKK